VALLASSSASPPAPHPIPVVLHHREQLAIRHDVHRPRGRLPRLLAGRRLDVLRLTEVGRNSPRRHKVVRCHDVRRVAEVDRAPMRCRLLLPAFMCPARRSGGLPVARGASGVEPG